MALRVARVQVIDRVVSVPRDATQRDVAWCRGYIRRRWGLLGTLVLARMRVLSLLAIAGTRIWESWQQRGLRQTGGMDEEVSALDVG